VAPEKDTVRVNERIRVPEVRVIGADRIDAYLERRRPNATAEGDVEGRPRRRWWSWM